MTTDRVGVPESPTLAIDAAVAARRRQGHDVLHLGFGEAGLPVLPSLQTVLAGAADRNSYGSVVGSDQARSAAAGWFSRRGRRTEANQVVFGPGSKPLLFAVLAAIDGDVVLPQPSWVSYAAQAALLGRTVVWVPIPADSGGVPDPERLEDALRRRGGGRMRPGVLVLTIPDNPTGTVASLDQVREVCRIADRYELAVICDEIYAELGHRGTAPSAATFIPERTVVTTGLSKSLALGGWRIGFARTPDSTWGRRVHRDLVGIASEVWSSLAAPMQAVAAHVLDDPPEVRARVDASRRLHARVAAAVYDVVVGAQLPCRAPQAGFYLYPDFGRLRSELAAHGSATSALLAARLLDHHGVAVLPGSAFGDPDTCLTVRVATSLLYGNNREQRLAALEAAEPEKLPWIADAVTKLRDELGRFAAREAVR